MKLRLVVLIVVIALLLAGAFAVQADGSDPANAWCRTVFDPASCAWIEVCAPHAVFMPVISEANP